MLNYNDLYEILRKEKYSESLMILPKDFIGDFSQFISEQKEESLKESDLFAENVMKTKKQLENSLAIFKELILRRKKKILNLIFVATETGIMKKDYENMLPFEKETFERVVAAFELGDKEIAKIFNGKKEGEVKNVNKMISIVQNVEQFVDMNGNLVGPFGTGEIANLSSEVAEILVAGGKASFIEDGQ